MIQVSTQSKASNRGALDGSYSYNEIVQYLDGLSPREYAPEAVQRAAQLDALFDTVSQKVATIIVGGINGKSTAMHFANKILTEEGVPTCLIYSTHLLTYNERLISSDAQIDNKLFTSIVGEVVTAAEQNDIKALRAEIMLIAGLLYAHRSGAELALIEAGLGGQYDPSAICQPKITVVTRIAEDVSRRLGADLDDVAQEMITIAKPDTWFISAEQSKLRLQKMKQWVEDRRAKWAMPIRKLAPLPYMHEQLYGRIASLGERIAQIYVEDIKQKFSPFLRGNLLATQQGQRGRPTLEAKRHAELNPIKTMKMFWNEQFSLLRGRFELLEKERPTVLLDTASNLDAFMNVFLGIRLLHYQKPLKGFVLIIGASRALHAGELVKSIRYLLKKVPGEVFFVPIADSQDCYQPDQLYALAKDFNVKARSFSTLAEAQAEAFAAVDDREGLVAITGSNSTVSGYWQNRGIKKF